MDLKSFLELAAETGSVELSVFNDATQKAIVYVGQTTTLDVTLTNQTGGDISLPVGSAPATLTIYLPQFYTKEDLEKMAISLDNWTFSVAGGGYALKLVYSGSTTGTWKQGDAISFKITKAESTQSPAPGQVDINLQNFTGNNVPLQVQSSLTLANPPKKGNGDLAQALSLSPASQEVYVSTSSDPLENTLTLTIKNVRSDGKSLYSGSKMWPGNPQIKVSFLYGNLPGDLAPGADKANPQVGSAWNIRGKVQFSEGNAWNVTNPDTGGQQNSPVWVLKPNSTNKSIIGTGANSNITFAFTDVVSLLPPGHTNMMVQFVDFPQNDSTKYNDHTFVLDIHKESEPERGILKFFSPDTTLKLPAFGDKLTARFQWDVFRVAKVELSCEGEDEIKGLPHIINYEPDQPLRSDSHAVDLAGFYASDDLKFVLKAYDGDGTEIDSRGFPIGIKFPPVKVDFSLPNSGNIDKDANIEVGIFPAALLAGSNPVSISVDGSAQIILPGTITPEGHWNYSGSYKELNEGNIFGLNEEHEFQLTVAQQFGRAYKPIKKTYSTYYIDPRDHKQYKVVELNGKIWMAENLDYDVGEGSWYYNDDSANGKIYGRLYTWEAAKKAPPPGWHVASKKEWDALADSMDPTFSSTGGSVQAYQALIKGGKSGFSALRSGVRGTDGEYGYLGSNGDYWSATEVSGELSAEFAWYYRFFGEGQRLYCTYDLTKSYGLACRCVKD